MLTKTGNKYFCLLVCEIVNWLHFSRALTISLLAEEELNDLTFSPQEIVDQIRRQWFDDSSFLPSNHLVRNEREFT